MFLYRLRVPAFLQALAVPTKPSDLDELDKLMEQVPGSGESFGDLGPLLSPDTCIMNYYDVL